MGHHHSHHDDQHHHDHGHDESGGNSRKHHSRRLRFTFAILAIYMVAEWMGGVLSNSLALMADAGHMLSDVASIGLALFAFWLAERPANPRRTYGYYRTEILAALANGSLLLAISAFIFHEAWQRLSHPPAILGPWMALIAAGGLIVNLVGLWLLSPGRSGNLNMRGAWLHALLDTFGSVAALTAGLCAWLLGWRFVDPVASMAIVLLVVYSAWSLLKETVAVLMESTPNHVDADRVRESLLAVPGVARVHDLHIWTITSGMDCLSGHVVLSNEGQAREVLAAIHKLVHDQFSIDHITIQIEDADFEEKRVCR